MILKFNKKYYHLSLTVLIIVFLVGLIGLNTPYQEQITALTPYSLLLTTVLILLNHREWNRYFVVYFLFCVISGFLVELIGIETRMIFGDYSFGQKLGYKVYAVPIVIGLNWFIMVYSTAEEIKTTNPGKLGVIVDHRQNSILLLPKKHPIGIDQSRPHRIVVGA